MNFDNVVDAVNIMMHDNCYGISKRRVTISTSGVVPASFKITAVPQTYGSTGVRSFFLATDGVIHGADKGGLPADENDPAL